MSNIIINKNHLQDLVRAARNIQARLDDGSIGRAFGNGGEEDAHTAVSAFDGLDKAAALVAAEDKIASPFLRYRREILATTIAGQHLRDLVLNLYADQAEAISLRQMIADFDDRFQRVALECIVHFTQNGDRDSHFMGLAMEIAEEWMEAAA